MSYLPFRSIGDADYRNRQEATARGCVYPVTHWWPDAVEINDLWYMDVSYGSDDGGVWLTEEERLNVITELPKE